MDVKRLLIAAALAVAGSAFATPAAYAAQHFSYFDSSKVPALTFVSQSRQNVYNWDTYVRYDDWGNFGRGQNSQQSILSGPDSKSQAPNIGHTVAPVPEPETYALMISGLLAVFMVARRRRDRS
jgi:PEP-CTERM motif